ncbi:pyruvate kinase-like isoform X2 [Harmonia axyridis]|nr:pyruvate kinase-like isoform X2 [Harmonia axyridis]XP_045467714.1 pyruvate kinase-like isoform X2 [Harmonia axyridis]XP_045467715.1 pyruvate kinase-like isoform X2 [Harmonia axyridis]XP_045467716.1 pyruvate kinase-like isoform X2 [Harmonia axyridis]
MASTKNVLLKRESKYDVTYLKHVCDLNINTEPQAVRLTGIVCTIGPASRDPLVLEKMMANGMNVARLNFSHGTHQYHKETIKNIRIAADNYSKKLGYFHPIAIALDTKGPEIRTGVLEGGISAEIELQEGDTIKLTADKNLYSKCNTKCVYVGLENLHKIVPLGVRIFIDDGQLALKCTKILADSIECVIENGGSLGSSKGVHIPGVPIDLPSVSDKDLQDINFGIAEDVDMVFLSFTRDADTVKRIQELVVKSGKQTQVIAKIENAPGMKNMDEIIANADGILIDRGDLGMAIPTQKVFLAQKMIIGKCNKAGKPIICATQMLESMTYKPRPTRAESSDVANAVLDGADCVMLSGETAKGHYPLECVKVMSDISKEAEAAVWQKQLFEDLSNEIHTKDNTHTIAIAAVAASIKNLSSAIVVLTTTGRSAHLISKYRPHCPIIAVTRSKQVARKSVIYRGILPIVHEEQLDDWIQDVNARVEYGINYGKKVGFIRKGDSVIVITGWREGRGFTNSMRIMEVD